MTRVARPRLWPRRQQRDIAREAATSAGRSTAAQAAGSGGARRGQSGGRGEPHHSALKCDRCARLISGAIAALLAQLLAPLGSLYGAQRRVQGALASPSIRHSRRSVSAI
jgi:hypothetical protein